MAITAFIVDKEEDFEYFKMKAKTLIGVDFPDAYFSQGFIRAIKNSKGRIIGGFALITKPPFRTLSSLPENFSHNLNENELFEITALWLEPKIGNGIPSCFLWYQLCKDILCLKSKKRCIYAYDLSNKKLARLYSYSDPTEVYRGKVKMLDGNTCENEEVIETASRFKIGVLPLIKLPIFFNKLVFSRRQAYLKNNEAFQYVRKLSKYVR